ncbi:hypothetical protein GGR52DRAFT_581283 [Hypoxylon sp. FL1284]|nr:hypothetical protein GGR52DRAFT_581283 [Hypoxylon sp. FL1284]
MPAVTAASAATTSSRRGSREPRGSTPRRVRSQLAGCILWLPRKSDLASGPETDGLEEDRCNHPVVVLSPQVDDGRVVYLMITSLKGFGLETRFSHDPNLRREHLPIRPCEPHPDNGMLLSLDDAALVMRKKSYVKTRTQYRIQLHSLTPYDHKGPEYLLSRRSYQELIEYAKFTPPPAHPGSHTVASPRRTRSASYTEYVNALRGLESGLGSPPRADGHPPHHVSIPSVAQARYPPPTEREPLVAAAAYGYPRHSYGSGGQPRAYPAGGHPVYAYRNASAAGHYHGSEPPPRPFNWARFWKIFKVVFWIAVAMFGFYGAMRSLQGLGGVAKDTAGAIKQGIGDIRTKLVEFWSGWGELEDLFPI